MKKLLTFLTLLTLGLTLTPAKAGFNSSPSIINLSGWNLDGNGGGSSFDGTYTEWYRGNGMVGYLRGDEDAILYVVLSTGQMIESGDGGGRYISFDSNGVPQDGNGLTLNFAPNWSVTDGEGNYMLSSNGYNSAPSPLTPSGPTLEDQAASVSAGLALQDGVFVPTR